MEFVTFEGLTVGSLVLVPFLLSWTHMICRQKTKAESIYYLVALPSVVWSCDVEYSTFYKIFNHCTLNVLIDFIWFRVNTQLEVLFTKTFDILPEIVNGISDLCLTPPRFEFLGLYLGMFDWNWIFLHEKWRF